MSDLVTPDQFIDDPGIRAAASRTLHVAKLAALKAAANLMDPAAYPLPNDPKALERIFVARLATRPKASQQRAVQRTKQLQTATPEARGRMFGDLAGIDLRSADSIATQAVKIPMRGAVAHVSAAKPAEHAAIASRADAVPTTTAGSGAAPPPGPSSAPGKTLTLRIHRVICAHTTDDGPGRHDEIKLGGIVVGPNGSVTARAAFKVSGSFVDPGAEEDPGDVSSVIYNPPHDFFNWTFTASGNEWPKNYTTSLILCEEDEGGFTGFLLDLATALKDTVEPLLTEAFGVFGTIIGWLLDGLLGWLESLWDDDPFCPITVHASIRSPHHTFASGTRTSDLKKYWTTMGVGKYWIYFDWKIST
jgi:hypothetical protein